MEIPGFCQNLKVGGGTQILPKSKGGWRYPDFTKIKSHYVLNILICPYTYQSNFKLCTLSIFNILLLKMQTWLNTVGGGALIWPNTRAWLYQRVQVHVWTKYLGLNLKMTPKVMYQSLDPKMWVHLNHFLTLICNTKIRGVNLVLNHLFQIQPHSDIWIIISRWRL